MISLSIKFLFPPGTVPVKEMLDDCTLGLTESHPRNQNYFPFNVPASGLGSYKQGIIICYFWVITVPWIGFLCVSVRVLLGKGK